MSTTQSNDHDKAAARLRDARRRLTAMRASVDGDLAESLPLDDVLDLGDIAFTEVEHEMDVAMEDLADTELDELDAAERRLADGAYGLCEDCGEPIGAARLAAIPWARRCLDHQQELEQRRTGYEAPR
jgi:DnaK suppressor protein